MKHQVIISLMIEQQRLGVFSLKVSIKPVVVAALVEDNWHPRMDMRDVLDGRCRDYRAAGQAKLVVMRPKAGEGEPFALGICNSHGSLPSSSLVVHSK